jgi:hypothetical protein
MNAEAKPGSSGTYYGEISPGGQWFWDGTGKPDDQWIANPAAAREPAPEPLVTPNLAKAHVQTLPPMDYANAAKYNLPAPPAGLTWVYMSQCWARHDIIRVNGLT